MMLKALTSSQEAIEVGFSEGSKMRQDGAKPKDLTDLGTRAHDAYRSVNRSGDDHFSPELRELR